MVGLGITVRLFYGYAALVLSGGLDYGSAADAEAAITPLVAQGQSLVIDMSALDFIDCSSLSVLLRMQSLARRAGGDVVLAAPQRHVLRLLALTGRDDAFCIRASAEAAVISIGTRQSRGRPAVRTACPERAMGLRTGIRA